jgi:hypothetical protein
MQKKPKGRRASGETYRSLAAAIALDRSGYLLKTPSQGRETEKERQHDELFDASPRNGGFLMHIDRCHRLQRG